MTNYILLGSIGLFFFVIIFISFKNKKRSKKRKINKNTLATFTDYTSIPTKENLNLIDNRSTANAGIIASQEKKLKKKQNIIQNKPIGWVPAKSYHEDILSTNISRYIPNSNIDIEDNATKTKKERKQELSILVVDDSVTVLKFVSNLFANENYNLIFKHDGVGAFDYLNSAEKIPDMIITDLEMIEMHGEELVNKIKEIDRFKNIPIILLSSDPLSNLNLIEEKLINGIVTKPFIKEDFIQQVSYLIG